VSPEVVKKAKAILKQQSQVLNLPAESSSSDSESSSSESDALSIAHSSISDNSDVSVPKFRLLEKNLKVMEVDLEDGHVRSIRIEV